MYLGDYIWFLGALVVCMIFSAAASRKVKSTFAKYNLTRCYRTSGGYDTATRLLRANGVFDISVGRVRGF